MPRLTESETRFQLKRALQQLPRSTLQDLVAGGRDRRKRGLEAAVDVLMARFEQLQVFGPEPIKVHGWIGPRPPNEAGNGRD